MTKILIKTCTKCDKVKELSEFHKSKEHKLGVKNACKDCVCAYVRELYKKNKADVAENINKKVKKVKVVDKGVTNVIVPKSDRRNLTEKELRQIAKKAGFYTVEYISTYTVFTSVLNP